MWQLRQALRRLVATPLFTMFAVLSLAVGVAVTTGVYSIVDAIFLNGLGVRDPDRVAFVGSPYGGRPLLLAAFWACYLPAHRAAGVEPHEALRAE